MRPFALLALAVMPTARAIYEHTLKDSNGADVPFSTFTLPSTPSSRAPLSKRATTFINSAWCGAIQVNPPSGSFTSVVGSWTVPTVTPPTDGTGINDPYYLYQWVGIDGDYWNSSCDALIQGGTGFILYQDTIYSLFVWTEYYPADPVGVNMTVSEGDVFTVNVTTTSTTTGVILIENHTTGEVLTTKIDGTGIGTLCGLTAEWINENPDDFAEPYPQYTPFDFTDCSTTDSSGFTEGLTGAEVWLGGSASNALRCFPTVISDSDLHLTYSDE